MILILHNALAKMPWKNGQGMTRQYWIYPENANLDNFDVRVSMANVAADGPFSNFAQIDRSLVVLEGEGLSLRFDDKIEQKQLHALHPIFEFDGEQNIFATLKGEAILDFNVMSRRSRVVHSLQKNMDPLAYASMSWQSFFCLSLCDQTCIVASESMQLGKYDALYLSQEEMLQAQFTKRGAWLVAMWQEI